MFFVTGRHECRPYVLYCVHMQTAVQGAGGVVNELFGDVVRFPVWWYTKGLRYAAERLWRLVRYYAQSLGVGVWLRNILVPMYGQYDWQSRLISFLVRSAQIVVRGMGVAIAAGIALVLFGMYVALPIVAVLMLLFHLTGGAFGIYGA